LKNKIKISAVSYLNTLPFIYGLEHSDIIKSIEMSRDYPALCAQKLINKEVDLGLIPVAEIIKIRDPQIVSRYCIGAVGKVNTVVLLSEVPFHEIESILLDYQSRTSVNLLKILLKQYWKIRIPLVDTSNGYEKEIKGKTAGLVIGDRVFSLMSAFEYVYDLSEIWLKYTGFPFVFAAWVSNETLPDTFLEDFNKALEFGLENRDKVIEIYKKENPESKVDIETYLKTDIRYTLDDDKRKGMNLFLDLLKTI
jgi:chorismate dehydratase